ncbi:hypothetical protein EV426DRAFT_223740 [Tirmania nivea]|nr:hypothetical protein EV426DRAFT_223740 [Tirmania nivea]
MAHLVYKAPLIDERARGRYIQTRKDLTEAKKRGDMDIKAYKGAMKNLEQAMGLAAQAGEGLPDADASLVLTRSISMSSGSTDSRTNKSSSQSGGLSRTMTGGSTAQKSIRKGTIFDRNNIGRLVYKEGGQSLEAREAMKADEKARKELKRLMKAYEASQNSVSSSYLTNRNISRTSTPLPVEDEGYSPRLAAESSKFYSTEPLAPLNLPGSSASSSRPKKNFKFFKWNGNRKNSSASGSSHTQSDASMSPISPAGDEIINTISATPRVDIDLGPPHLSLASAFNHNVDLNDRVRSMSVSDGMIHRRSESLASCNTHFSTAPSSMRRTITSESSASSAILAKRASNDTLQSVSTLSRIGSCAAPAESTSGFSCSSDEHELNAKPAKRTMADLFLFGSTGSASKRSNRETFAFVPSSRSSSVVRFQQGRIAGTVDLQRPKTAGSSKSLRRRHSIGSDFSAPLSTGSRTSTDVYKNKRPAPSVQKSRAGNEDAFASMFCAPKRKTPKKGTDVSAPAPPAAPQTPKAEDPVVTPVPSVVELRRKPLRAKSAVETPPAVKKDKTVYSSRILSLPAASWIGQAYEYPAPTASPPPLSPPRPPSSPNFQLDPLHDPLPAPPSSILLDAFISLLEEYSSAPKLFSFSRPKAPSVTSHRTARQGRLLRKGSFVSTTHSVSETIAEETSPSSPSSPTTSAGKYLTISPQGTTSDSTTDDEESSETRVCCLVPECI